MTTDRKKSTPVIISTHGVVDTLPQWLLTVFAQNFGNKQRRCQKRKMLWLYWDLQRISLTQSRKPYEKTRNIQSDINIVPIYEEPKSREAQRNCHGKVHFTDEEAFIRDRMKEVQIEGNLGCAGKAFSKCLNSTRRYRTATWDVSTLQNTASNRTPTTNAQSSPQRSERNPSQWSFKNEMSNSCSPS